MTNSILLLSSVVVASASSSSIMVANAPSFGPSSAPSSPPSSAPSNHQYSQQQHLEEELWYSSFSSSSHDYEGGTRVTSPLSAISAHIAIPGVDEFYVDEAADVDVEVREWCCAFWYPDQEDCARKESSDDFVVCWDERDHQLLNDAQEGEEEAYYNYYPVFRDAYEESGCAKATNNQENDDEFTTESGQPLHSSWMHSSHADCCQEWFGQQESQSCLTNVEEASSAAKSRRISSEVNEGINVTMTPSKPVVC